MGFFAKNFKRLSFFLRSIDIYGQKTELTMNGKTNYTTNIGGIFTLLICLLSILKAKSASLGLKVVSPNLLQGELGNRVL